MVNLVSRPAKVHLVNKPEIDIGQIKSEDLEPNALAPVSPVIAEVSTKCSYNPMYE